ncbi:MAG TPA: hypothetical protein VKP30_26450 [Polyangiaceae bacterium]|nr:hypothetical protein [Polyangiaceae bacterium]
MVDFDLPVWADAQIYTVDFGRAALRAPHTHPHRACPPVDRYGYMDDANPAEHGPIVSCSVGQPRINVAFIRCEISATARLYAVPADGVRTIRILSPHSGRLPDTRQTTIAFRPMAVGRTSIDVRYFWPDGPIVGRLYVEVRALRNVNCRFHLVELNGAGWGANFLGQALPAGMGQAVHHAQRIDEMVEGVNHIYLPHGIQIVKSEVVNTAWTNALFPGGPAQPFMQVMRAMADSPNRSAARINIFLVDWTQATASATPPPFALGFRALGPPVAWAIAMNARWPNTPLGHVGSGIVVDSSAMPMNPSTLAHELGHIFHLSAMTGAGAVKQWHTIGDNAASRDDSLTRRRLMYPYATLANSNNPWRNDVGYGAGMRGTLLVQRSLHQDDTFQESRRAYDHAIAAHVYAL